jgi:aspartate/methionine/tyrosine aminotransferase
MFSHQEIQLDLLKKQAFNLRWAAVPEGVIPLTAADPDFPCAPEISEAIQRNAAQRYFSYAPAEGHVFFREAVANFHTIKRQVPTHTDQVIAVDSAAYGIYLVCKALLEPGDEAIVFNPVDFLFKYSVEANDGVAVPFSVPIQADGAIDFEELEELISPKTKLICLCNPLNPTGKVFTRFELERLGQLALKYRLVILSDEIWSDIVFAPNKYISIASLDENLRQQCIIVTGYSKSFGLAGLRVGSVIAPNKTLFNQLLAASNHLSTVHGCNVLGQVAVATALNDCSYWLEGFLSHLTRIRNICVDGLNDIPGFHCFVPQGCYLAFPNITGTGKDAQTLQSLLLEKGKVAVVPGLSQWFGERAKGHLRISFATSEELIKEGLSRIKNTIESL